MVTLELRRGDSQGYATFSPLSFSIRVLAKSCCEIPQNCLRPGADTIQLKTANRLYGRPRFSMFLKDSFESRCRSTFESGFWIAWPGLHSPNRPLVNSSRLREADDCRAVLHFSKRNRECSVCILGVFSSLYLLCFPGGPRVAGPRRGVGRGRQRGVEPRARGD